MKRYECPSAHVTEHIGPLDNEQIAALSDAELEAYLREHGWWESKKLYRASDEYVFRQIAGEGVLVPTGGKPGNVMVTLNSTCAFLWNQLGEARTIGDLIAAAKAAYDDPQGDMEAHIRAFVKEKVQTGHIREVE